MSDQSSFSIQNPRQVISHLLILLRHKCRLSIHFGAETEPCTTILLGINEDKNILILDVSRQETVNNQLLKASKLTFDTEFDGIKVSFGAPVLKKTTFKDEPAFSIPIPSSIFWMQRREYYRVKSPFTEASYCQIVLELEDKEPVNLKLYDISLTGFSMFNISKEISDLLVVGEPIVNQCKLILADIGEIAVSFEVCSKYMVNLDKQKKVQKIGCRLINVTSQIEELIQHYMYHIQREKLNK